MPNAPSWVWFALAILIILAILWLIGLPVRVD